MNADLQEATHEELILGLLVDGGTDFVSGEALSGKLGLSRTAVWKVVNALRRHGYRIEAVPSRGYRLLESPDRLTALGAGAAAGPPPATSTSIVPSCSDRSFRRSGHRS